MQVTIRKCGLKDMAILIEMRLEFLKELRKLNNEENFSRLYSVIQESIETRIDKDLHFWLAEIAGEPVATGAVCVWDKLPLHPANDADSKIGYVLNMYTRRNYRKNGIANLILHEIAQYLRDENIPKALLHASEDGKGVYKRFGFSTKENLMEMKL